MFSPGRGNRGATGDRRDSISISSHRRKRDKGRKMKYAEGRGKAYDGLFFLVTIFFLLLFACSREKKKITRTEGPWGSCSSSGSCCPSISSQRLAPSSPSRRDRARRGLFSASVLFSFFVGKRMARKTYTHAYTDQWTTTKLTPSDFFFVSPLTSISKIHDEKEPKMTSGRRLAKHMTTFVSLLPPLCCYYSSSSLYFIILAVMGFRPLFWGTFLGPFVLPARMRRGVRMSE